MKNFKGTRRVLPLLFGAFCLSSLGGSNIKQPINFAWAENSPTTPDMVVTEKNNGDAVKLKTGQLIEVRLESNATTGYEWTIVKQDEEALKMIGKPAFIAPQTGRAGAAGQQVFLFQAKKTGLTELRFVYARPFETGKAPARIFDLTVDIQ